MKRSNWLIFLALVWVLPSGSQGQDTGALRLTVDGDPTPDSAAISVPPDLSRLLITSSPKGARIAIGSKTAKILTPAEIDVPAGEITVEMTLEGYEPLSHTQEYAAGKVVSLHFLLRSRPPNPPQAEELDLVYQPTIPMRDEKSAERMRKTFTGLAETFAIIPTGQGLLAKFLASDDAQQEANMLLISGVTLSVGSWLCSKILPARKLAGIKKWNSRAAEANSLARAHNSKIEILLQEKYAELIDDWASENEDRGVVKVTVH